MDNTDSTLTNSAVTETPTQSGGAAGVQPNSDNLDALVTKLRETLLPEIDTMVKRATQSSKDRRFAKLEKEMRDTYKNKLVEDGMDPDEAEEVIASRLPSPSPKKPVPNSQTAATGTSDPVAEAERMVLEGAGMKEDDPDYLALKQRGSYTLRDVAALVAKRAVPVQASPAGALTPSGQATDKTTQYVQEMKAAAGKGYRVGNEIKERYRKLGVEVDSTPIR